MPRLVAVGAVATRTGVFFAEINALLIEVFFITSFNVVIVATIITLFVVLTTATSDFVIFLVNFFVRFIVILLIRL